VAIKKRVPDRRPGAAPNATKDVPQPAFSYPPTDALAQVIVNAWANPGQLLQRNAQGQPTPAAVQEATQKINAAGFDLARAVIITEAEHDDDYTSIAAEEVVFVLPNQNRLTVPGMHLLDTAKLLMACTPNGI
jgi:hypothetical protein